MSCSLWRFNLPIDPDIAWPVLWFFLYQLFSSHWFWLWVIPFTLSRYWAYGGIQLFLLGAWLHQGSVFVVMLIYYPSQDWRDWSLYVIFPFSLKKYSKGTVSVNRSLILKIYDLHSILRKNNFTDEIFCMVWWELFSNKDNACPSLTMNSTLNHYFHYIHHRYCTSHQKPRYLNKFSNNVRRISSNKSLITITHRNRKRILDYRCTC